MNVIGNKHVGNDSMTKSYIICFQITKQTDLTPQIEKKESNVYFFNRSLISKK